jgi:flavin-dependent dehydrogenase
MVMLLGLFLELVASKCTGNGTHDAMTAGVLAASVVASCASSDGAHEATVAFLLHVGISWAVVLWRWSIGISWIRLLGIWALLRKLMRRSRSGILSLRRLWWIAAATG